MNKILVLLRLIKNYLPLSGRKTFFNARILPHVDCSSTRQLTTSEYTPIHPEKRASIILDIKNIRAPENRFSILFLQLGWMFIYHRIVFRKATMVYKSLNNLAPPYMAKLFKYLP